MTDTLDVADVAAIVRLMAGVAAMPAEVAARRRHLLSGLADLVGAEVWAWGQFRLDDDGVPVYFSFIDDGFANDAQRVLAMQPNYTREGGAILAMVLGNPPQHRTRTRGQLVSDTDWYRSPVYLTSRRPADLDEAMFSFYPLGEGTFSGLGMHRRTGRPQFSDRDRCIVHLIMTEVDWLHRTGSNVRGAEHVAELSPRLRQVLLLLLGGDSRKQIARKLNLSEHTIADYLKALHVHFQVNSRGELLARFISGDATPTTSGA